MKYDIEGFDYNYNNYYADYYRVSRDRIDYDVTDAEASLCGSDDECYYVTVENTGDDSGEFRVECEAKTDEGTFRDSDTQYIRDGDEEEFVCDPGVNEDSNPRWDYDVTSLDYDDEDDRYDYRNRPIERTRTVTKYRTEIVCY